MITIVDLNLGNVKSVLNMVRHLGFEARISCEVDHILAAESLILPGVGAFDEGMLRIREFGLRESLDMAVLVKKTPILGICLGMQLMTRCSEEGRLLGLGWVEAETRRFHPADFPKPLPVPHMGWNTAKPAKASSLLTGLEGNRFYFVHSFYVECSNQADALTTTHYGRQFHSGFLAGNISGVQFHPEKSHRFGKQLLRNFCGDEHA